MNKELLKLLQEEKRELDEKIALLKAFLSSDDSDDVDVYQIGCMHKQLDIMIKYSNILNERIILL